MEFLKGKNRYKNAVQRNDIEKQYRQLPSFADHLPWLEWSQEEQVMLLEDRRSVGQVLEIRDLPCEAISPQRIEELHKKITTIFSSVVPLCEEDPWVLQFFIQAEPSLESFYHKLEEYIAEKNCLDDPFVQKYLEVQRHHYKILCQEQGLFTDPMSGLPFRGRINRIRLCVYRRYENASKKIDHNSVTELKTATDSLISRLKQAGLSVRRLKGEQIYDWWVRWFNPSPKITDSDQDVLLKRFHYPKEKKPFGWSFSQNIFFNTVESYTEGWLFDGIKHKVLVFQDLQNPIDIGVISMERAFGNGQSKYALFDKFPAGSIYTIQVVFESKNKINKHLEALEKAAVGKGEVIKDILANINRARYEINENNNMLFRCVEAIYFKENPKEPLSATENHLQSLLSDSGLLIYQSKDEFYPIDSYLRFLPFNFNYHFDRKYNFRSTYKYADDVARLLPIYGRSRGDGQYPLFANFFNRGGEPFIFDHLNKNFKMSNSHMAVIGTTGAGKSVTLNSICLSLSAVYNPHIIVIEVGGSFDLTAKYLQEHGRHVGVMKFDRQNPVAVNPYAEAYKALAILEVEERFHKEEVIDEIALEHAEVIAAEIIDRSKMANDSELACEEDRDILNEMMLATRIMITRGDTKEENNIDLTDMTLINRTLIHAMKTCKANHVPQMQVMHVAASFEVLSKQASNEKHQLRLQEFGMRLDYYVKDIVRSKFMNRPSEPLAEYDFLQIDFGFMQSDTYRDLMNVVCISIFSKILALAEANKSSGRPTILILDEAHVFFKSEMVATFIILMAKVARKIGLWLMPCTQNINDFTGFESRKVLSMMETWLCLALDREEVKLLEQFKPLSDEMRDLVLDIRKYPGIYSEGVLLGKRYSGLFRHVPPRIALSLAMTEQDERSERKKLQIEKGLSELEAVEEMAKNLEKVRAKENIDEGFF